MNYKDFLIDSQKSGVSAFLEFSLQYHNFDNVIANFIEGQDYSYYRSRVENTINSIYEVLFFPCNGKKEVELVHKMINNNLNIKENVKILYYCDSDYNICEKKQGIYYTDYYSVENFYSSENFVIKIINNVFNINKYNPDFQICLNLFRQTYEEYYNQIRKINAFGITLRKKEYNNPRLSRKNLSDIKIRDLIENYKFDNFSMRKLEFPDIVSLINVDIDISKEEYEIELNNFDNKMLRGKWELEFICWFLEELRKNIKEGNFGLSKNSKLKISFQNQIMVSMERYADTPDSLITYIKENVQ